MTGIGAERMAVDNVHNDLTAGWTERLISCIKALLPFTVSVVFASNNDDWLTSIAAALDTMMITFPPEKGYSTGAVYSMQAALTRYVAGAGDIQSRVNAEITITPSGQLTITPGTHP